MPPIPNALIDIFLFDNHYQRNKEEKRKEFDEDEDRAREEEGGAPTEMMEQHGKGNVRFGITVMSYGSISNG